MSESLDITPAQMKTVRSLLRRHLPGVAAWAYGSRVKWTSRPESDLDLVVFASPDQQANVSDLREAFEESNLPFRVDLFVWDEVPEKFRKTIKAERFVVQEEVERGGTEAGEYPNAQLGEVASVRSGFAFKSRDMGDSGIPIIKIKNLVPPTVETCDCVRVPNQVIENIPGVERYALKDGDILIAMTGATVGKVSRFPRTNGRYFVNQRVGKVYLTQPEAANYRYLYYVLSQDICVQQMFGTADGSAQANISGKQIESLEIPLPFVETQKAIAEILGSLDDKIKLNRVMNGTLESLAGAIFKAWFIDFEPVKAKAAGAASFPGIPQNLFDQLPNKLTNSELGLIPEGWEYVPIGDLVKVVGGGTPSTKKPEFWENGEHPFCTPKDMSRLNSPVLLDTGRHITQAGVAKISSGQLPVGTVLLSSRAPIGYLALAETPVSVNQGIIAMCTGDIPNVYVLLWTEENMEVIKARASGSTFAEISKRNFRPIPALRPNTQSLTAFDDIARPLYELIVSNERESCTLAIIRDALLPKLISGELRVSEANSTFERGVV